MRYEWIEKLIMHQVNTTVKNKKIERRNIVRIQIFYQGTTDLLFILKNVF